jgi:hypothetical protein
VSTSAPRIAESRQPVWIVPASPVVWALHFMLCYVTAAIWCGRVAGPQDSLGAARLAIGVYTVIALTAIATIGWLGYRAHTLGGEEPPHDADSPHDRHRFIGFATLLLSGLSAVATIYSALAALIIRTCE